MFRTTFGNTHWQYLKSNNELIQQRTESDIAFMGLVEILIPMVIWLLSNVEPLGFF